MTSPVKNYKNVTAVKITVVSGIRQNDKTIITKKNSVKITTVTSNEGNPLENRVLNSSVNSDKGNASVKVQVITSDKEHKNNSKVLTLDMFMDRSQLLYNEFLNTTYPLFTRKPNNRNSKNALSVSGPLHYLKNPNSDHLQHELIYLKQNQIPIGLRPMQHERNSHTGNIKVINSIPIQTFSSIEDRELSRHGKVNSDPFNGRNVDRSLNITNQTRRNLHFGFIGTHSENAITAQNRNKTIKGIAIKIPESEITMHANNAKAADAHTPSDMVFKTVSGVDKLAKPPRLTEPATSSNHWDNTGFDNGMRSTTNSPTTATTLTFIIDTDKPAVVTVPNSTSAPATETSVARQSITDTASPVTSSVEQSVSRRKASKSEAEKPQSQPSTPSEKVNPATESPLEVRHTDISATSNSIKNVIIAKPDFSERNSTSAHLSSTMKPQIEPTRLFEPSSKSTSTSEDANTTLSYNSREPKPFNMTEYVQNLVKFSLSNLNWNKPAAEKVKPQRPKIAGKGKNTEKRRRLLIIRRFGSRPSPRHTHKIASNSHFDKNVQASSGHVTTPPFTLNFGNIGTTTSNINFGSISTVPPDIGLNLGVSTMTQNLGNFNNFMSSLNPVSGLGTATPTLDGSFNNINTLPSALNTNIGVFGANGPFLGGLPNGLKGTTANQMIVGEPEIEQPNFGNALNSGTVNTNTINVLSGLGSTGTSGTFANILSSLQGTGGFSSMSSSLNANTGGLGTNTVMPNANAGTAANGNMMGELEFEQPNNGNSMNPGNVNTIPSSTLSNFGGLSSGLLNTGLGITSAINSGFGNSNAFSSSLGTNMGLLDNMALTLNSGLPTSAMSSGLGNTGGNPMGNTMIGEPEIEQPQGNAVNAGSGNLNSLSGSALAGFAGGSSATSAFGSSNTGNGQLPLRMMDFR